jgi:hypothetical protein
VLLALSLRADPQPTVTVDPAEALYDERVAIRITGLEPNHSFTLRATTIDSAKRRWTSETPFRSAPDGAFDFSRTGSAEESMKPFWSMRMAPGTPPIPAPFTPVSGSFEIRLEVVDGGRVVADGVARRLVTTAGVKVSEIREQGLVGRLYEPVGTGKHPTVLVLTGSNGGIPWHHAGLLASRGFVAFALAYFHRPTASGPGRDSD